MLAKEHVAEAFEHMLPIEVHGQVVPAALEIEQPEW